MTERRPEWQARPERGSQFWLAALLFGSRLLGRGFARLMLIPTTLYFLLGAPVAVRASRQFLARSLGRPPTLTDVARHIHCFAATVLDRAFFLMDRKQDFSVQVIRSPEAHRACYESGRGCLLFVAHLGSFEVLRVVASGHGAIKVLLDKARSPRLTSVLENVNPGFAAGIIDASHGGPGLVLAIKQALDEDARVGLMVDRPAPGEQTITAEFFGRPAKFPAGPWQLAAALQAPVVLVFCPFRGGNRYDAHFELFSERLIVPRAHRAEELQACVQRYAARLEHYAREHPYNWFNFYDFWA